MKMPVDHHKTQFVLRINQNFQPHFISIFYFQRFLSQYSIDPGCILIHTSPISCKNNVKESEQIDLVLRLSFTPSNLVIIHSRPQGIWRSSSLFLLIIHHPMCAYLFRIWFHYGKGISENLLVRCSRTRNYATCGWRGLTRKAAKTRIITSAEREKAVFDRRK